MEYSGKIHTTVVTEDMWPASFVIINGQSLEAYEPQ